MELDLDITLERRKEGFFFGYRLRAGKFRRTFESSIFQEEPSEFRNRLTSIVEDFNRGLGPGRDLVRRKRVRRRLYALGQELYHDLLPAALRSTFWDLRGDLSALQVCSEEPWVPWEMLCPFEHATSRCEDYLAATYVLTRRLPIQPPPPRRLKQKRILFIDLSASRSGAVLTEAARERASLRKLAMRLGVEMKVLEHPTAEEFEAAVLEGDLGIIHASAHGAFEAISPDESALIVAGSRSLRPSDLYGDLRVVLRRERPLVFFNACRLGAQGWSLTRLGGWTNRLFECYCSAYVAPEWTVKDSSAAHFAAAFYESLGDGETLGAAALAARRKTRDKDPDGSAWLAYRVYGHPDASLRPVADEPRRFHLKLGSKGAPG